MNNRAHEIFYMYQELKNRQFAAQFWYTFYLSSTIFAIPINNVIAQKGGEADPPSPTCLHPHVIRNT